MENQLTESEAESVALEAIRCEGTPASFMRLSDHNRRKVKQVLQEYGYTIFRDRRYQGTFPVTIRDFSYPRRKELPEDLKELKEAEDFEEMRQKIGYVTKEEIQLAKKFKKHPLVPTDYIEKDKLTYGLLWESCAIDQSAKPPRLVKSTPPSKAQLSKLRQLIWDATESQRIHNGAKAGAKLTPECIKEFRQHKNKMAQFGRKEGEEETFEGEHVPWTEKVKNVVANSVDWLKKIVS